MVFFTIKKSSNFSLRFSTVYGFSPRMRFDLTVNEFTRNMVIENFQEIWGEQFWRPYAHVDDLCRASILVLESDIFCFDNLKFNCLRKFCR